MADAPRILSRTEPRCAFAVIMSALGLRSRATFPDQPIKLIVPFGPGGPPDVAARIIGA